ncbi:TPA: helix-turn-helix domain-containing protein [Burkholderia vietnamiensis]|nr:helix-turn-helix domain-containing protein [Burkholderia vietnamiensis]
MITTNVPTSPDDLLSTTEAARVLGKSTALVETLMKEGSLTAVKHTRGKSIMRNFRRGDVEAYRDAMNARMTLKEVQEALGIRSQDSVRVLVKRGHLTLHPPLPHRGTGSTYDREEVQRLAAERKASGTIGTTRGGAPYTSYKEADRAALIAVLAAWPVLDDRSEEAQPGVQQTEQGGRLYPSKHRGGDAMSPLGLTAPWQTW